MPIRSLRTELPDSFWTGMLPQLMDTSSAQSPYFLAYKAAQVKLGDKGFLSRDITVQDLLMNRSDVHHVFPAQSPEEAGACRAAATTRLPTLCLPRARSTSPSATKPREVFSASWPNSATAEKRSMAASRAPTHMKANLRANCLPETLLEGTIPAYDDFLEERRRLMALKIKQWFEVL